MGVSWSSKLLSSSGPVLQHWGSPGRPRALGALAHGCCGGWRAMGQGSGTSRTLDSATHRLRRRRLSTGQGKCHGPGRVPWTWAWSAALPNLVGTLAVVGPLLADKRGRALPQRCLACHGPLPNRDVAEDGRQDVMAARVPGEAASAEPSACREQTKHNPQYLF